MKKIFAFFRPSENESGVALIMVMTAMIIMIALWGEFTFESKLSRIKTTNILDKSQSRLVAESGIEFAMVRLKMFKEAYNLWQSNAEAKKNVPLKMINQLWEIPFIYPITLDKDAGAQAKAAVEEFQKESMLDGEMKVSIQNISNRMNLNMMRITSLKNQTASGAQAGDQSGANGGTPDPNANGGSQSGSGSGSGTGPTLDPNFAMEAQIVKYMRARILEMSEKDEDFRSRYGNTNLNQLVANLKFYISDKNPRRQNNSDIDMMMDASEQFFNEAKIAPKHGPLSSMNEMYLIPGWDDTLIEILRGEFDVFSIVMIDLNRLTENMLRLLIPSINDDEVKAFFKYRDDPEEPHSFNTLEDFKRYVVEIENIMNDSSFDDEFEKYKAQGIQFGAAPTLFRIISEGTLNRSSTTLVATIAFPAQQQSSTGAQAGSNAGAQAGSNSGAQAGSNSGAQAGSNSGAQAGSTGGASLDPSAQLQDPIILEMQAN